MNILIATDAWHPQVNGVVRSLEATINVLKARGNKVLVVSPNPNARFAFRFPFYPEIIIDPVGCVRVSQVVKDFKPDCVHIATEFVLGWAVRNYCIRKQLPFTTSYHTKFPEYAVERLPSFMRTEIQKVSYALLRRFHRPASQTMVSTPTVEQELRDRGFQNLSRWSRGVDTDLFQPYGKDHARYRDLSRPIILSVGRVAVEKNLPAFLNLKSPGTKVVVGDGPARSHLQSMFPDVVFVGEHKGQDLARLFAAADLFVFPSLTDTFGLVLLEACASGLRVAACNVAGPRDVLAREKARAFSVLDDDLQVAVDRALALPDLPAVPRQFVQDHFTWEASTDQFESNLQHPTRRAVRRLERLSRRLWSIRQNFNLNP